MINPNNLNKIQLNRNEECPWNFYIENLNNISGQRGIYFIFDKEDNLIYIGQSNHISIRIEQHSKTSMWFKPYARKISFIEIEEENLKNIEMEYILKYNPRFNSESINYDNSHTSFNFMLNQTKHMKEWIEGWKPEDRK